MQPEQLGPFRIGRVLGRGGMGAVYEGVHVETGEVAAVKVLLSTLQEDDELRQRFEGEIDTLKRLRHPNIVRLFGFGEEQGMLYYVMELVDGPSLHQEMKRQRLFQWHEVAKIGLEMCLAFKHAHDRGITHRDIKPANILLEQQGSLKLSDFGIAHFFGGQRFTEAHSVVGTLEFMSPEQALANPVGARSDLYSLGAVLYSLLVGRPPFTARGLPEILRKHQTGVVESIRAARLDVPDELELIIFDLLKIRQEERPHNAYLVVKRFQSLLQALVGPPERIFVKPMESDSPTTPSLGPVHIPYKGDQQDQSDKVILSRGIFVDNGVIDLGGIVSSESAKKFDVEPAPPVEVTKTQLVQTVKLEHYGNGDVADMINVDNVSLTLPIETGITSLANSFGRPSDYLNLSEQQTLEMSAPIAVDSKQVMTDSFSVSTSVQNLPLELADTLIDQKVEESQLDDHRQSTIQPPNVSFEIYGIKEVEKPEAGKGIKPLTGNSLFRSEIQHGEIVLEDVSEMPRSKDDPLPDINVFEALQRPQSNDNVEVEKKEEEEEDSEKTIEVDLPSFNTKNDGISDDSEATVDGLGTDYVPGRSLLPPPLNQVKHESKKGTVPEAEKSADLYGLESPQKSVSGTVSGSREKNSTIIDRPSSPSHFTAVKDETFNDFDSPPKNHPLISLQTVLVSCGLILIGFTFYYLLQPIPADTLYERIKQAIDEGNDGDELAPSALRKAEGDINNFLSEYVQHPMADQVRLYQTELDLAKKEQELKRRQRLAHSDISNPVEQAYMEAITLIKTDPEEAIVKLKAIIDVFRTEKKPEVSETPTAIPTVIPKRVRTNRRQHLNPPELCVELATRRLEKLEKTIETTQTEQLDSIWSRLHKADELEATQPARAEAIRRGIIELYQNRRWAKAIVEEAQQKLKK